MAISSKNNQPIVLASGSPRRFDLLDQLGIPFVVKKSTLEETFDPTHKPASIVQDLASQKAADVCSHYADAITIGADTVVAFDGKIIGKPATKQQARQTLQSLSHNTHRVLTGVALMTTDNEMNIANKKVFYDETFVTFGKLSSHMIDAYVATGDPMDKAGAYGIQSKWGALFVKQIKGNYNNVIGLPTYKLYHHLKQLAPNILTHNFELNEAD